MRSFMRTTIVGGFLFLTPLAFVVAVFGKAFQVIKVVATPLDNLFPIETVAGVAFVEVLTVLIMLLCCFVAGLFARSSAGGKAFEKIEAMFLQLVPGYAWVKGVTGYISDHEAESVLKPVLVRFDDQSQLAFEVDRTDGGLVAVYLPGAPNPSSGVLSYVTADRIEPVDATFEAVARTCKNLGRGSSEMLFL